ncbi:phage head-tail connector protein [Ligilactobacillus aviarius]|uniref:phage head-tail connector protein n=1 Tax=Ligilactobacillus aviarius TaxID=1606 RepID=UPI00388E9675
MTDEMTIVPLNDLKTMLMIKDNEQDDLLTLIIKKTVKSTRFKLGLGTQDDFPSEMDYIPFEVCIRRYNRLKNEGMSSYTQEGEAITFNANDFDDFASDIEAFKKQNNKDDTPRVMFINGYGGTDDEIQ